MKAAHYSDCGMRFEPRKQRP